ncbi:Alpha/Beta hydrolase protein [Chlamydoabsidia padenii]|nr:Alpha/Beta hydrolase protein [Chlamydoabsidia padenii]
MKVVTQWLKVLLLLLNVIYIHARRSHQHQQHHHFQKNTTLLSSFKQPTLCDPTVVQYSGYIQVDTNEHYFFWFFESRNKPAEDPLLMWLNGGPGCSSMTGLFEEIGPCGINANATEAIYNEVGSWNKVANLLFLDQPDGAGFSYGDNNVDSTEKAKFRVYRFLQQFFKALPQYKKLQFHLFGESFAGHFVPAIGNYILKQNQNPTDPDHQHINLQSIGIGNGITDVMIQVQYSENMACYSSYGSVLPEKDCHEMRNNTPTCVKMLQKCADTETVLDCDKATNWCSKNVENIYLRSGRNVYDIRANRTDGAGTKYNRYLNLRPVRKLIGAKTPFHRCPPEIRRTFYRNGDYPKNYAPDVANLLNNGIPVLLYVGDADYRANWYGVHGWAQVFDFDASEQYRTQILNPWIIDGQEMGQIQAGGNLTFIRVYNAGHKVPYYQPRAALVMFANHIKQFSV